MKLFTHSQGYIFAFGFDMVKRKPDPHLICWCDPNTLDWNPEATNHAGNMYLRFVVAPEFILEAGGKVIAFQSGRCLELTHIGFPCVWGLTSLAAAPVDLSLVA